MMNLLLLVISQWNRQDQDHRYLLQRRPYQGDHYLQVHLRTLIYYPYLLIINYWAAFKIKKLEHYTKQKRS